MDNFFLVSPQGSVWNLGSFLQVDPGPDFGSGALEAVISQTPAADGGRLAYEFIGPRHMAFPLLLASNGVWTGLLPLEAMLRQAARPGGAYLDLIPEGVATAEAVRFDVITGRWRPEYRIREHAVTRRRGVLELDTQPFGYWPTWVTLASVASVALPGSLVVPGGSVIGDIPGFAEVTVRPTTASSFTNAAITVDVLAWSLTGHPSFVGHWKAASVTNAALEAATLAADPFAVGSQALRGALRVEPWEVHVTARISSSIATAHRGRHRVFAYLKLTPSMAEPMLVSADTAFFTSDTFFPLASAAPVATVPPNVSSGAGTGGFGAQGSGAFHLFDLGEVSIPAFASGLGEDTYLRLWTRYPSPISSPTPVLHCGGFQLVPVGDKAGLYPRGLSFPTLGQNRSNVWVRLDSFAGHNTLYDMGIDAPLADGNTVYRGVLPYVAGTSARLELFNADRRTNTVAVDHPLLRAGPAFAEASVRYRPRFSFLKGI